MATGRRGALAGALALMALVVAGVANAQVSTSLTLQSDYRVRGVSLTDKRPVLSGALGYDSPSGFYAGGSLIAQDTADQGAQLLGHIEYFGFAFDRGSQLAWEVGIDNQNFKLGGPNSFRLKYTEVYVGVTRKDFSARIYYSPNYINSDWSAVYLSLDGALRPADNWRVSGHVGVFKRLNDTGDLRARADLQLGLTREFTGGEIQVSGIVAAPGGHVTDGRPRAT